RWKSSCTISLAAMSSSFIWLALSRSRSGGRMNSYYALRSYAERRHDGLNLQFSDMFLDRFPSLETAVSWGERLLTGGSRCYYEVWHVDEDERETFFHCNGFTVG